MQRLRSQILAAGVLAFVACDTPPPSGAVATVTDSAGVEIVTSPEPASPLIRIDTVPDLSIGGPEEGGAAAFGRIENLAVGPDGSIWVSDRQTADVRVFNPDGSHRVTVGGRGDGPWEYAVVRLLGVAGDSVAAQDAVSPPTEFTSEPSAVFVWNGEGVTTAVPFTANAQLDAGREIHVVAGPVFQVRHFDSDGSPTRISRVARDSMPHRPGVSPGTCSFPTEASPARSRCPADSR